MDVPTTGANLAWLAANTPGGLLFQHAISDTRRAQEQLLAHYLNRNRDTVFGRRHRFADIKNLTDYQSRVPLSAYEDYEGDVQRIADGEPQVLTRDPVRLFEPSSGSTRAAKWIPYTAALQSEFRRAIAPWLFDLLRHRPGLLAGPAYWCVTPAPVRECSRTSQVPIGFESDTAYLGGTLQRLAARTLLANHDLGHLHDLGTFRHFTLLRLLANRQLRLISVWHPSFLNLLMTHMERSWGQLIDDLGRGLDIPNGRGRLGADLQRARELAALSEVDPTRIWPHLGLISCWGDGHASASLARVAEHFQGVELQPKGLIATEAFVSLPFGDHHVLAVRSHFFEFLDDCGTAWPAWALESGAEYRIVVTTGGGLYRYQLNDRISVEGFRGSAPCLRFLGKEDGISDRFGEKLSERFVSDCIDSVMTQHGLSAGFVLLALDDRQDPARYVLYIESEHVALERSIQSVCAELDTRLQGNPNYRDCRRLGQLACCTATQVPDGAYERYLARLYRRGQRWGDIKASALSSLTGWHDALRTSQR